VKDTIEWRDGKWVHTKRVNEYELVSGDFTSITQAINTDIVILTTTLTGYTHDNSADDNAFIKGYKQVSTNNSDDLLAQINTFYIGAPSNIRFRVAKDTYADLAAARTALTGTKILYQLATPIETELITIGDLQSKTNGTIYVDDVIVDIKVYNNGITVTDLEEVLYLSRIYPSLDEDEITNPTINGNVITHADLNNGDYVYVEYRTTRTLAPYTKLTIPTNTKTQVNNNTKSIIEINRDLRSVDNQLQAVKVEVQDKVDKETGKVLSTNDYTTTEKNKLAAIASNAQVNVIESIKINSDTITPSAKAVTLPTANSSTQKDGLITWQEKVLIASHETKLNAMAGAYIYRGVISQSQPTAQQLTDRINALLSRTPALGDVLLDLNGVEWYYDGTNWLNMGQNIIHPASTSVLGLVKLNYTENGNNKKVRIDGNNDVYVTIPDVSNDTQGLMTTAYKVKLDNIQTLVSWALFFGTQVINKTSQYLFTTDMLRLKNAYLEIDTSEGVLMTNINGNGAFSGTQEGITYEIESTSSGFSFTYVDGTPASITINEIRFYPFGSQ
jgi:hypothetical protein